MSIYKVMLLRSTKNEILSLCYTTSVPKAIREIEKYSEKNFDFNYQLTEVKNVEQVYINLYNNYKIIEVNDLNSDSVDSEFHIFKINVI